MGATDKRTWWVITGVYVFKNRRKPEMMLTYDGKGELVPDIYPSRDEAQDEADNCYHDEKYWKDVKVVEVKITPNP